MTGPSLIAGGWRSPVGQGSLRPAEWTVACQWRWLVSVAALSAAMVAGRFAACADETTRRVAGAQLTIELDPREVVVRDQSGTLLRYRYADVTHKPYVAALTTSRGENVLRDAPADHLHHHGLMFACGVDGSNFWEEKSGAGKQVHVDWSRLDVLSIPRRTEPTAAATEAAILEETLHWERPDGARPLTERRTIVVFTSFLDGPRLFEWQSQLTAAADGPGATLAGANYYGLGMRFVAELDNSGRFFNAAGNAGVDGTNAARAAWCAYAAELGPERPVTIAAFDAAGNPRHPATWFTMDRPFAYLSATLGLASEPVVLAAGQTLSLRYGVVLFSKDATAAEIHAAYQDWQQLLAVLACERAAR